MYVGYIQAKQVMSIDTALHDKYSPSLYKLTTSNSNKSLVVKRVVK